MNGTQSGRNANVEYERATRADAQRDKRPERYFAIACGNKLTGERGLLGYVELSEPASRRYLNLYETNGQTDELFPPSVRTRAHYFRVIAVKGGREQLIEDFGPEII